MNSEKWVVELWTPGENLEISAEKKEILEKILLGDLENTPLFVSVSREIIAVTNIAGIRRAENLRTIPFCVDISEMAKEKMTVVNR